MSRFGDIVEAVEGGRFSEAIPPRDELAKAGYQVLYWPRPKGGDE